MLDARPQHHANTLWHICVSVMIEQLTSHLFFFCIFFKCFPEMFKSNKSFHLKCKVGFHGVRPWECRWTRVWVYKVLTEGNSAAAEWQFWLLRWREGGGRRGKSEERKTSCRCAATVLWTDTHLLRVWAWSNYCLISGPTSLNEVFSAWSELKFTVIFNTAIIISIPAPQQFLCM